MPIPDGGFRLHWDARDGEHVYHRYEDFECMHDALERAGRIYALNCGTLTRLENWFGEDACPADQLLPVAKIRAAGHDRDASHNAMESNPLYGTF
ncbi:MAG TPA: hypothetical protein H9899_07060 [Candidatus Sphingomonas excrementigallinarum]|nr:hypothetical protein [Candidatus Sphingomonas excrementigallinarum]